MSFIKVLNASYKLAYDEHIGRLLSIPEKYLADIRPDKQIPYSDIFESYNSDIAQELNEFGNKLLVETKRILSSKGIVSSEDREEVTKGIGIHLQANLYIKRFDIFIESIGRTLSRYGLDFEPEKYRVDIQRSLAETNLNNKCRKIQMNILNEFDIFILSKNHNEPRSRIYSSLNDFYKNNQLLFWVIAIVIPVILGVIFV